MRSFLLGGLIGISLVGVAMLGVVLMTFNALSLAEIRTGLVKLYSSVPAAVVRNSIETGLLEHDHERVVRALSNQFRISQSMGFSSTMIDDLVNSATLLSNTQTTSKPLRSFLDLIDVVQEAAPKRYEFLVLRARAYETIDPRRAAIEARKALAHIPADERPYRTLMRIAAGTGDATALNRLCAQYRSASAGSFEVRSKPMMGRPSQGLRFMYLEFGDGVEMPRFAVHNGIQLGVPALYGFALVKLKNLQAFRLHLPFVPGVSVRMHEVRFFTESGVTTLNIDDMIVLPTNGYALTNDTFVSASPNGDTLTLMAGDGDFPSAYHIEFKLTVQRLPLIGGSSCAKSRS
jgi:hypothetical protein